MPARRIAPFVLLLALAACPGKGKDKSEPGAIPRCTTNGIVSVGEPIPADCRFERIDGGEIRLASLAGKPAVINFWAAWCTFCIEEMPAFQRVYVSLGGKVEFLGADLLNVQGETRSTAMTFAKSTGVGYPLIFDTGGYLYAHFSAQLVMPVTIFVNAKGVVTHRRFGPQTEKQLRDLIREHLGVTGT